MRTSTLFYLILISTLLTFKQGNATNYYFSTLNGDDSRTTLEAQNPATPWQTIDKLNEIAPTLQAGDSILFRRGEAFEGNIVIAQSGSSTAPIVLSGYGNGPAPIISGFTKVSDWVYIGNGIYESRALATQSTLNMVLIDSVNYAMGRFPNADAPNKGYLNFEEDDEEFSITDYELEANPNWSGATAVIRMRRWILDRVEIDEHDGQTLFLNSESDYVPQVGYGYFIQNHIRTLDQFGEWFYKRSSKKLAVYFGSDRPENHEIYVSTRNYLFEIKGDFVVLDGLQIEGANSYGIFCAQRGMTDLTVKNCKINFSGINGIYLIEGANFILESSEIWNTNNNGVYLVFRSPNAQIRNNKIINTGMQAGMGLSGDGNYIGVFCRSSGLTAEHNEILNTGYNGLQFYQSNILIRNNYIDGFCLVKDDGGGIYTFSGNSPTFFNRKVLNNIVLNGPGVPEGARNTANRVGVGIYMDSKAMNVEIAGNTVENCSRSGINLHDCNTFNIHDNVLSNNDIQLTIVHDERVLSPTGGIIRNNILLSSEDGQRSLSIKMQADDLNNVGSLYDNFYIRPLDKIEAPSIYVEYLKPNNARINNYYTLEDWQSVSGKDWGSQASPVAYEDFSIVDTDTLNQARNNTFDTDIAPLDCWGGVGPCLMTWDTKDELDGGAVKIETSDQANFHIRVGAVDQTKKYLFKFSVIGEKVGSFSFYLRQTFSPFDILTEIKTVRIDEERTDYEFIFPYPKPETEASIHFNSGNENLTFWLDNVGLYEVQADVVEPEDVVLVAYNPTLEPKVIDLEGKYMDVSNNEYTESITLRPFESMVLLVDTTGATVLPVELSSFTANEVDCEVELQWISNLELNFSHYELERSIDGWRFERIAKISGVNTNRTQYYSAIDPDPRRTNYYRLKLVDEDGSFTYSRVVVQLVDCEVLTGNWKVYPTIVNPANPILTTEIYSLEPELHFLISDATGRVIQDSKLPVQRGWNTISIDVSALPSGMYFMRHPLLGEAVRRFLVE